MDTLKTLVNNKLKTQERPEFKLISYCDTTGVKSEEFQFLGYFLKSDLKDASEEFNELLKALNHHMYKAHTPRVHSTFDKLIAQGEKEDIKFFSREEKYEYLYEWKKQEDLRKIQFEENEIK